jgi:predicted Zn-dependent peptidase
MANTMLDRKQAPQAAPLEKIPFPAVDRVALDNGVEVYMLQTGTQEIVELTALFVAGKSHEPALSVASFTAKMLQEGTRRRSGLEYARAIDSFGAFVHVESGYETASIGLTTLAKHLANTIPLWMEMLLEPAFPSDEFEKLRTRTLQHIDVEEQKTGYIARKMFNRLLFGHLHPYGSHSEKEDIAKIELQQLVGFHASNFHAANATIVAAGRFDQDQLIGLLNKTIGSPRLADPSQRLLLSDVKLAIAPEPPASGLQYFEKADSMQATLRVGHRAFARSHPDYYPMQVVNTVLGGYFGSRLMKNIREEKGYTYGIGSAWLSMKYDGLFMIQTDVANAYIQPTLDEITKEVQLLIDKGVTESELDLVRKYMLGRSASSRETPAQLAGIIQNALTNSFDFQELDRKFDILMAMKKEDVQRLAQQYLRPEKMLSVVCGKMEKA